MDKYKLSVIIPIYNVENYINTCLNSITNQTYSNLEIIIIDDGSTDNSPILCDKWAKKDKRIEVIHQENKGVSNARNLGIEKASGNYITFIDADDYIEADCYKYMISKLENKSYDILIYNFITEIGDKKIVNHNQDSMPMEINSSSYYIYYLLRKNFYGYCWNKIYKAEILKKFKFCENIYILEDLLINCQIANDCNSIYYEKKAFYHYNVRKNSAVTSTTFSNKNVSALLAIEEIIKILENTNSSLLDEYRLIFFVDSKIALYKMYKYKIESKETEKMAIYMNNEILKSGIFNKKASIKLKLKSFILAYFPKIYIILKGV